MAGFLDQLTSLTRGSEAATAENPKLLPGSPANFFQLFSKVPITPTLPPDFAGSSRVSSTADAPQVGLSAGSPKQSFWATPAGSTLQSLLGTLALGGLGAGIGAIASPGARGLGAARGFGVGAVKAIDQDLAMRKSAAQIPSNLLDEQLRAMQLQQAQANLDPLSHREYKLAYPGQEISYSDFLKERRVTPLGLANLELGKERLGFQKSQADRQYGLKVKQFQAANQDNINALTAVESTIDKAYQALEKLPPGGLGLQGRSYEYLAKVGKAPKEYQDYVTNMNLSLSNIARNLGGEKGVLTDQDIARVQKAIFQPYMNPEQRQAAYNEIKDLLRTRVQQSQKKNALIMGVNPEDISSFSTGNESEGQSYKLEDVAAEIARRKGGK